MILLKQIDSFEVSMMKDIFGNYLCRVWNHYGFEYVESLNRNKFTAYRNAIKLMKERNSYLVI